MRTAMTLFSAVALAATALSPTIASASVWARHHPRQAQVLHHERNQLHRINEERREGDLTGAQARALRASDRAVWRQDRADARANGGYITRSQQRALNSELNAEGRTIPR